MTIEEMHYDFKMKMNKLDSAQNRNLIIPEIDWILNEAQEIFVKTIMQPRNVQKMGLESNQRSIEDLKNLIKTESGDLHVDDPSPEPTYTIGLLSDYWYFLKGEAALRKNTCSAIGKIHIKQHEDEFKNDPFNKSSFEWRTVNGLFNEGGLKLFTDNTFSIEDCTLTYIKTPKYMHNAVGFTGGTYTLPSDKILRNKQDCELSPHTHREIVDIGVLIATGNINLPDYQTKMAKIQLNTT